MYLFIIKKKDMLKKVQLFIGMWSVFLLISANHLLFAQQELENIEISTYTIVIEGFDWGPAVSKVIVEMADSILLTNANDFKIEVERSSDCTELSEDQKFGKLNILQTYVSDHKGKRLQKGNSSL